MKKYLIAIIMSLFLFKSSISEAKEFDSEKYGRVILKNSIRAKLCATSINKRIEEFINISFDNFNPKELEAIVNDLFPNNSCKKSQEEIIVAEIDILPFSSKKLLEEQPINELIFLFHNKVLRSSNKQHKYEKNKKGDMAYIAAQLLSSNSLNMSEADAPESYKAWFSFYSPKKDKESWPKSSSDLHDLFFLDQGILYKLSKVEEEKSNIVIWETPLQANFRPQKETIPIF